MKKHIAPEVWSLTVRPLSPVHIGAGRSIEPIEYVLERKGQDCWLTVIDLDGLLSGLDAAQRREFNRHAQGDHFPQLRGWLRSQVRPEHELYTIQVQDPAFRELEKTVDDPRRAGEVELMTRDAATGRPFIPGSSIKGAIRTAVLREVLDQRQGRSGERRNGQRFEAEVLGNTNERGGPDLYRDPFRQVAISDVHLEPDAGYIDQVKIVRRPDRAAPERPRRGGASAEGGILMFRDVTWSTLDEAEINGTGELRLHRHLADGATMGRDRRRGENAVPRSIGVADICRACTTFYVERLYGELEKFDTLDGFDEDFAPTLRREVEALSAEGERPSCLIRLGRHAHFECITLDAPYAQTPKRGAGGTRSRVAGLLPLGWATLTFDRRG